MRAVIGGKFSTDADPSQNLKENLIDDISLEYMLTKRDNMYLKVFRHTGYERRNHRNGRGLRDPEKTAEAGRPVQVDETQSEKTETR